MCRVHDSEPASVQSKLQSKDPGSLFLNFMQVQTALPHGTEQHVLVLFFFFSSHTCHILSAKGEIKGRLSPKKRGRNVLIYPALELFIKARSAQQPTEPPSPFAFLTSIYILFITYSTLEPQSLGCGQNKCACRRSLSARLGLGYLSCRDSLRGYFWRLGKIVCFPLKQWAGSV